MSKSIGSKILGLRTDLKLTTEQMAHALDVSPGFLSHLEKNHCTISPELATKLLNLGVKITQAEYTAHNESAGKWMREYRADLKAKKEAAKKATKVKFSSANPQLPGFTGIVNNARIEELVAAMIVERMQGKISAAAFAQPEVESDDFEVTPIFKKA